MNPGDKVALFYGRNKDGDLYFFGHGTYEGEHVFENEEDVKKLVTAMPFDATTTSNLAGATQHVGYAKQKKFRLDKVIDEENAVIYDQECWFVTPERAEQILMGSSEIHMLSIKNLRDAHIAIYNKPRIMKGFLQINISFEKIEVSSADDAEADIGQILMDRIRGNTDFGEPGSPFGHLPDSAFEIKVRSCEEELCCNNHDHGPAVGIRHPRPDPMEDDEEVLLPYCSKCLQELDSK